MAKVTDPVCKMEIEDNSEFHTTHEGKEYYFCATGCKVTFEENPAEQLKGAQEGSQEATQGENQTP